MIMKDCRAHSPERPAAGAAWRDRARTDRHPQAATATFMILVDTSVWIDHFRHGQPSLEALLEQREVLTHPWVIGELALGRLARRQEILWLVVRLPQAVVASPDEVLALIDRNELYGRSIGYVDVQLLAATRLAAEGAYGQRTRRCVLSRSVWGAARMHAEDNRVPDVVWGLPGLIP